MSSKKCELFGLVGLELQLAYNSLLKLKESFVYEESEEEEGLSLHTTVQHLTKFKITFTGVIDLKPNSEEQIAATTSELWSSANLHHE